MKRSMIVLALILIAPMLQAERLVDYVTRRGSKIGPMAARQRASQLQTETKQTEPPASAGSASLLDDTSSADLFSAAFRLAHITTGDGDEAGLASGTATAYAIAAAFRGVDPLSPVFYNDHRKLRQLSFSVGTNKATDTTPETNIYHVKWRFASGRDAVTASTDSDWDQLVAQNVAANVITTDVFSDVQIYIQSLSRLGFDRETIGNADKVWETELTEEEQEEIDALIGRAAAALESLDTSARELIDRIRAKPQFALAVTMKDPTDGHNTYVGELIYDQGIPGTDMYVTANLGAELARDDGGGRDTTYRGALRGRWEIAAARAGKRGSYFDLTGEAKKHAGERDVFKAQGKLTLPISGGVDLPISVTWANRDDLIDESHVSGHVGFTFDFSKLMELVRTP